MDPAIICNNRIVVSNLAAYRSSGNFCICKFFEKIGFKVKYPYNFSHVIGDPSVLSRGEKYTGCWNG